MRKFTIFILLIAAVQTGNLKGQEKEELREIFVQADDHYLFREYEDAVVLFPILDDGSNFNIYYKMGVSYLNIPNEKEKAISFLEKAVRNTHYEARDDQFTEKRAPLDAYFYLGNAYRINNELDKAISTYNKFKELMSEENKMVNADFVDQAIRACEIAKELRNSPVSFIPENLGENINLVSINIDPAISGDETSLAYTAKFGDDNVIFYSIYNAGRWEPAIDITDELGSKKDVTTSALSYDGKELYLYKTDDQDGNIYFSKLQDNGTWSKIQKLNKNINTKYYESHASISADGNRLYFTSNRKNGSGELDIYYSEKGKGGDWGKAVNLGELINTPFNENTPFITANDSLLYFSSEGHHNMGGYDIFYTRITEDGDWSTPVNIGYPINSTDDDLFLNPVENGSGAYLAMEDGYKEMNLYRIEILPAGTKRMFEIKGIMALEDTVIQFNEDFRITLFDIGKDEVLDVSYPNRQTGQYLFVAESGDYVLEFEGRGYETEKKEVKIEAGARNSEFIIDALLVPGYTAPEITTVDSSLAHIGETAAPMLDTSRVITDLALEDVDFESADESSVLYITVQLMALTVKPVDVTYFLPLTGIDVIYGKDGFYRYTYGRYETIEEAEDVRQELINMGYSNDIWIKKVYRQED